MLVQLCPARFNAASKAERVMTTLEGLTIEGVKIGQGQPCRFVAEISNNHNGDIGLATSLIDAAKSAGADFVKFQCYTVDELLELRGDGPAPAPWGEQGWTMRTLYTKASTPIGWFPKLFAHARKIGIVPFASVFGKQSLALLESVDCPLYKIARLDAHNEWLVDAVCQRRPVFLSTALPPSSTYVGDARRMQLANLLYCPPGYPTAIADVHLPKFTPVRHRWGYWGLSSHCLDPLLPIAAVARGAKLLEYHFMSAYAPSELEANISLNHFQFNQMVHDVRRVEEMLCGE